MTNRTVVRLSGALLAFFVLGCGDDDPSAPSGPFLEVAPLFRGIEEGESVQLTATLAGQSVPVTWESTDPAKATVSPTGLVTGSDDACAGEPVTTPPCGSGFVAVTATMTSDPSQQRSASITVLKLQGIGLTSGVPVTGLSSDDEPGSTVLYRIRVPAGATNLLVTMSGGTGDADLYVRYQTPPTPDDFDCRPFAGGNNEECEFSDPTAGTWYIMIELFDPYAGVTLTATVTP